MNIDAGWQFNRIQFVFSFFNLRISSHFSTALIGVQPTLKTAFITALYRFVEINSGKIYVSNKNIADVQIDRLRRSINFIPGDPVLFNGSIRYNLDPGREKSDERLMVVLQKLSLWEKVSKFPKKMDSPASSLFTVWERKLLFLARSLLNCCSKVSHNLFCRQCRRRIEILYKLFFCRY